MNIILASKSPRRKELLEQIGIIPEIIVSEADENIDEKDPQSLVMKLSKIKAEAVFDDVKERNEEFCVLGADTVVFADDSILGKPENKEEARRMIKGLQGKYHYVYTGFTLIFSDKRIITDYCETKVYVYSMTDDEIEEYISTCEPYDKAGAYGIQGLFGRYVEKIDGDYNNVVGLPVSKIMRYI